MSSLHRWSFAVIAALAFAAPASAQVKPSAPEAPAWDASSVLTTLDRDLGAWNGFLEWEPATSPFEAPLFEEGVENSGEDVALMVVGGAALVVGSIIGGDAGTLMMVGGGVLGLLGLFRYVS